MKLKDSVAEKINEALKNLVSKSDERVVRHEELFAVMKRFEAVKTMAGLKINVGVRNTNVNINGIVHSVRVVTLEKLEYPANGIVSDNVYGRIGQPFCYAYWTPHDQNFWVGTWNAAGPVAAQPFGCLEEVVVGITERIMVS